MKTLGFAMALALTGGAAQAGSVFEVPINGGIARIQLDDNCQQSVCASAKSNRWDGRIYNSKNGQTYTANISMNDPQTLRVEGCEFGGLICGGQNWARVN